ncbi:MAG: aminotransferase class I/II-fold pyridoxal phosphate-dependent enzyme [Candidatus Nanopelagicales bacterium]
MADEAYEHLWFDNNRHIPIASLPGMWDRTVTIGSGGKSFSFTGWKVGWASGPAELIAAVRVVRQHLSYVSGGPFQYAMAAGLRLPDVYFDQFREGLAHAARPVVRWARGSGVYESSRRRARTSRPRTCGRQGSPPARNSVNGCPTRPVSWRFRSRP